MALDKAETFPYYFQIQLTGEQRKRIQELATREDTTPPEMVEKFLVSLSERPLPEDEEPSAQQALHFSTEESPTKVEAGASALPLGDVEKLTIPETKVKRT